MLQDWICLKVEFVNWWSKFVVHKIEANFWRSVAEARREAKAGAERVI
jgi:hypothetical protein